mmetsp:Transcript_529/g.958  ORF Transcript_529/g.958 Transcript_529/m.958 type:complete len:87 (+) Transcript_529:340-600(+)
MYLPWRVPLQFYTWLQSLEDVYIKNLMADCAGTHFIVEAVYTNEMSTRNQEQDRNLQAAHIATGKLFVDHTIQEVLNELESHACQP